MLLQEGVHDPQVFTADLLEGRQAAGEAAAEQPGEAESEDAWTRRPQPAEAGQTEVQQARTQQTGTQPAEAQPAETQQAGAQPPELEAFVRRIAQEEVSRALETMPAAVPAVPAAAPASSQAVPAQGQDGRINLNTATREELMQLKGIGASKADAIIAYRETYGGFGYIEEIMNIRGIKEAAFEKIKDRICV